MNMNSVPDITLKALKHQVQSILCLYCSKLFTF